MSLKRLPKFESVSRKPLYLQIADAMQEYIVESDLHPGDKLPTEQDFAEAFDVGRSTVREGFRVLQASGVVDIRQHRGAVVKEPVLKDLFSQLAFGLQRSRGLLAELWETRFILELGALPFIIARHTSVDLSNMDRLIEKMKAVSGDQDKYHELDHRFHKQMLRATCNSVIIGFGQVVDDFFANHIAGEYSDLNRLHSLFTEEHRQIRDAIASQDLVAAQRALTNHLKRFQARCE